ncbi:hypothetical protein SO802_021717 [Lithocarpus litseifolius]|uniref:Uncharacterized protein n=1 Tax=Lithocarpus litseifolius TaxID=425828 RepID=A0AAW2CGZ1_9ROSI
MEVLPEGRHYLPKHLEENIKYYKSILIQEKFARVENIMNKGDLSVVLYHKFIITGFVSCKDWGGTPPCLRRSQDALRYFSSRFWITSHNSQFPSILHMIARYRIHWISMWNYAINNNLLNKEFSVKWWDSLKIDPIISQIHKDFPPLV